MRDLILIEADQLPVTRVYGRDISIKHYRQSLGITQGDVYWDASGGLRPNALAGIAGTIKDNHHFYLYLPEAYTHGDPDHLQMIDHGRPIKLAKPYFNQRLRRILSQTPSIQASWRNAETEFKLTPQVILGKRGRGKSTWLAKKIRWLLQREQQKMPTILLVTTFAAHRQRIVNLLSDHELANIIMLPPDEACRVMPSAEYLIIDEAASIPTNQLQQLLEHYANFSLASSEDGYEGGGRFFTLQTLPSLKQRYPSLETITLHQGRRFVAQDLLERRIEQIFFPHSHQSEECSPSQAISIKQVSQERLANDESLLEQIYGLLFEGHYKTRPADLKRLLDLPDQQLIAAFAQSRPIAVLHVLIEQPLAPDLALQVIRNTRRPRGRLLMQQLLLHTQQAHFAMTPLARIQRIVTEKTHRRQGIASRLVRHALDTIPYIFGVSYGSTPSLDQFWQHLDFKVIARSPKQNPRTGRHNIIQLHQK